MSTRGINRLLIGHGRPQRVTPKHPDVDWRHTEDNDWFCHHHSSVCGGHIKEKYPSDGGCACTIGWVMVHVDENARWNSTSFLLQLLPLLAYSLGLLSVLRWDQAPSTIPPFKEQTKSSNSTNMLPKPWKIWLRAWAVFVWLVLLALAWQQPRSSLLRSWCQRPLMPQKGLKRLRTTITWAHLIWSAPPTL